MYKDLSLKEKAKVLLYGGKLGLTSIKDIAKLYDDAIGHKFLGDTESQMNNSSGVLKWNEELLDFVYSVPEVTIAYDLPDRNLDKQGFNKYVDSFAKSYTDGNINISDINRLPFLYRNATLGKIGSTRKLKMSSDSVKRKEFEDIQKKIKKYSPSYPTKYPGYRGYWLWNKEIDELDGIEKRMNNGDYWNVDEMLLDLNRYELIVSKRQNYKDAIKERDDYLSNYAGRYLNSRIPFVDPFKEDANSLPSQLFRYAKRHNLFGLNEDKHVSLESKEMVGGKGTDIISLDNNVIRLSPDSKQSSALFNEFVETLNPSIYRASDYKLGNVSTFGDSHIPTENVSLFLGVEDGKFKIGNIEDFKDDTYVYPVRNIKKLYSAPIKKISVILNGQEGISKDYVGLLRQKVSYRTPYDEMVMDFYDLYDPWGGTKKESEAHWNSYNSTENIKYALKKHPEAAKYIIYKDKSGYTYNEIMLLINDGAFSNGNLWFEGRMPNYIYAAFDKTRNNYPETKRLKEIYDKKFNELSEDTDNPYHTINEIRANLELERTKAYNDFIKKHPGLAPLENRENKYLVTDINDSTYNVSNLNASILDNKMVLGNPNGGVFIGRFLDISLPLLDSLNSYLSKNPSWISRNDLGSFDQYRLDSPSLGEYLKLYYENPSPNDPNVYVVGTTQPNKLWSNSYAKGGPIVSPYGQWRYPGRDTIIPSNNITMDNVNYPVLGISDTGDTKVMMPWNDYKFKGSMVYEHPLIGNIYLEQYKKGGSIHIKPENRGKFTALKKRTGHSASWFKAHGTPALKKMATFALNARHWKHDDGGHLFLGDNSYLLTLFDKYGPNSLVIQINKPVRLNEVLIVADAPKPGDFNYDRYIANTYDAWQRGDVDINTLSTETRNRVRGYSGTIAALKGMNTAAKVAGITAAIPAGIIGGVSFAPTAWSIMNNPIVDAGLTIHGAINAPKNIKEGVQLLQEGNYGRGALDLGLTALDLYGAGKLVNHGKNATKRLAEVFVRQGDDLHDITPSYTKELLTKKETLDYVFKGGKHPELAYRTGNYSGNVLKSNYATPHEGDVVDVFFGKPKNKSEYARELKFEDLSPEMQSYINRNYRRKRNRIKIFDLGEVSDASGYDGTRSWGLYRKTELPDQEEFKALGIRPAVEEQYLLDPGGYNHVKDVIEGDRVRHFNEDIWKFNSKDYKNKYKRYIERKSLGNTKLSKFAKSLGLKFIDTMGTPVVHTWNTATPVRMNDVLNNIKTQNNNVTTHSIDELIDFFNN